MRMKGRVLSVEVYDFLSDIRRKRTFLSFRNWRRWPCWESRSHSRLAKEIGAIGAGAWRNACFRTSLLWGLAPQDDGSYHFVIPLRRIFTEWSDLLPAMGWFVTLIPTLRHGRSLFREARWVELPLKRIVHGFSCPDKEPLSTSEFFSQWILSIWVNLHIGRGRALLDWVEGPDPRGRGFQGMGSTSRDRLVPGQQVSQGKRLLMHPTSRRGVPQGSGIHGSCAFFQTTGGTDTDAGVVSACAGVA